MINWLAVQPKTSFSLRLRLEEWALLAPPARLWHLIPVASSSKIKFRIYAIFPTPPKFVGICCLWLRLRGCRSQKIVINSSNFTPTLTAFDTPNTRPRRQRLSIRISSVRELILGWLFSLIWGFEPSRWVTMLNYQMFVSLVQALG